MKNISSFWILRRQHVSVVSFNSCKHLETVYSDFQDRIGSVFNAELPETPKITDIQDWFWVTSLFADNLLYLWNSQISHFQHLIRFLCFKVKSQSQIYLCSTFHVQNNSKCFTEIKALQQGAEKYVKEYKKKELK